MRTRDGAACELGMAPAMGRFPGFPRRDAEYLQSASIPATSHCCSSGWLPVSTRTEDTRHPGGENPGISPLLAPCRARKLHHLGSASPKSLCTIRCVNSRSAGDIRQIRKGVVWGKRVEVREDLGGCGVIKK